LIGSFEFIPNSAPYQLLTSVYTDAFSSINSTNGYTYPTPTPTMRNDFIFSYPKNDTNFTITASRVIQKHQYSNHLPIMTMFTIPNNTFI
jgi:hypothetical protein